MSVSLGQNLDEEMNMPPTIKRNNLLYENVVHELTEMINSGAVVPGGQFPPERELVKSLGISRNVLREAFHMLEEKGIIYSAQGKGRFLHDVATNNSDDGIMVLKLQKYSLLDLYQVRLILEEGIMNILAKTATINDIDDLSDKLNSLAKQWKADDNKTVGEFSMHLAYAEKCHNDYLYFLLKETTTRAFKIINSGFMNYASDPSKARADKYIEDHSTIIRAIRGRDAMKASVVMNEHLSLAIDEVEKFHP